jgi:hypothetical protein
MTSFTVPGAPKFKLTLASGSILPLALTEARMVPRVAVAVRSAAAVVVVVLGAAPHAVSTSEVNINIIKLLNIQLRFCMFPSL